MQFGSGLMTWIPSSRIPSPKVFSIPSLDTSSNRLTERRVATYLTRRKKTASPAIYFVLCVRVGCNLQQRMMNVGNGDLRLASSEARGSWRPRLFLEQTVLFKLR